jgi:hypothetical protein
LFHLFAAVPVLGAIRFTGYFFVATQTALAVVAGLGAAALLGRVPWPAGRAAVALLLGAGVLFDAWSSPLSMSGGEVPAVYAQLAADPVPGAVAELPLSWKDGYGGLGDFFSERQYAATLHHRPLVNGFTSRVPKETFDYFRAKPELQTLIEPRKPADPAADDAARVRATLRELGVRYLVVHPGPEDTRARLERYLDRLGLPRAVEEKDLTIYRLD